MILLDLLPELLQNIIKKMNLQKLIRFSRVCKYTHSLSLPQIIKITKSIPILPHNDINPGINPYIPFLKENDFRYISYGCQETSTIKFIHNIIKCAEKGEWKMLWDIQTHFPNFLKNINPIFYEKLWPQTIIKTRYSFHNLLCRLNEIDYIQNSGYKWKCPHIYFYHVILSFFIPPFGNKGTPLPKERDRAYFEQTPKYKENSIYRKKLIKSLLIGNKELICHYNLCDAIRRGDIQTVETLMSLGVNPRVAFKVAIIKDSIQQRLVKFKNENLKEKIIEQIYRTDNRTNIPESYHLYRILFNETESDEWLWGKLTSLAMPYDYYETLGEIRYFNFKYYNLEESDLYFSMLKLMLDKDSREAFCEYDNVSFKRMVLNCAGEITDTALEYTTLFENKRCYDLLMEYKI